jgi:phosphoribosylaminoimidazolecarboxamide formyltransferase / IMP cyclohydrolase
MSKNSVSKIKSALISVYYKDGLEDIVRECKRLGITIYTTGGTQTFIEGLGIQVVRVEDLTSYPSILGGRVKTLHPKVFGGILAIRNEDHLGQLKQYEIPAIDLVIVDLYPFEETVASGAGHPEIIEKIDIGGISLIRAAAKNYNDVTIISSKDQYPSLYSLLSERNGEISIEERHKFSMEAFMISSHYDTAIFKYMAGDCKHEVLKLSQLISEPLRYGENPHQNGYFYGDLDEIFDKKCGKELSYNNLVDVDAAIILMSEFKDADPTFAILKHTNACGVATDLTIVGAWHKALAADPVSAFGGILISNKKIDLATAHEIDKIFYEVLIAPDYDPDALQLLSSKAKRIVLSLKVWPSQNWQYKSLLNGAIGQDADTTVEDISKYICKTVLAPSQSQFRDLRMANILAKHLKSNTIVLVKDGQLLGMGCGQTSRVDACRNAIDKAKQFGFDLNGAVMASDAFFPFPDCVELVYSEGISAVIQPGGSIKDQLSIDFCDTHSMTMVFTGTRHFKH